MGATGATGAADALRPLPCPRRQGDLDRGRSPGFRILASAAFPGADAPSGARRSLPGHSCGTAAGLHCSSLFASALRRHPRSSPHAFSVEGGSIRRAGGASSSPAPFGHRLAAAWPPLAAATAAGPPRPRRASPRSRRPGGRRFRQPPPAVRRAAAVTGTAAATGAAAARGAAAVTGAAAARGAAAVTDAAARDRRRPPAVRPERGNGTFHLKPHRMRLRIRRD
jgi:hypothetical protein